MEGDTFQTTSRLLSLHTNQIMTSSIAPISKSSTHKRKQQGILFSFLKPKAMAVPVEKPKDSKRMTSKSGLDRKPDVKN